MVDKLQRTHNGFYKLILTTNEMLIFSNLQKRVKRFTHWENQKVRSNFDFHKTFKSRIEKWKVNEQIETWVEFACCLFIYLYPQIVVHYILDTYKTGFCFQDVTINRTTYSREIQFMKYLSQYLVQLLTKSRRVGQTVLNNIKKYLFVGL